ncbi:sensor histidine kinase [Exiguobacterium sp. s150]|uniref:sensor histidine kinase n=1 Tax=Exiguobacterium sp. s150 TaxID=2751221 RepID=UPI001BE6F2FF|nr:histidine kinase [Exiguobacterium sp. s150]
MTVNSIRTKLTGMIALTILIPVILATIISYWYVKDRERERGLQLTEWSLERGTLQFERYISDLSRLPTSLYANRDVLDILEYGPGLSLEQTELEVRRALLGMYLSREDVAQIQLLILEDMDSFAAYKMKVSPRSKKQPSPIQQQLLENKESRVLLEASHPLVPYHDFGPILSEQEVVTLHFRLDKIETDTPLAVLSIDIPEDVFVGQLASLQNSPDESLWFVGAGDQVFAHLGTEPIPETLAPMSVSRDGKHHRIIKSFEFENQAFYVGKSIPDRLLTEPASRTSFIIFIVGIASLVLALIGATYASMRLTTPIRTLTSNIRRIEQGDMTVSFDSLGNDEFGVLGRQFKLMIERIDDLIQREYRLALENRTNELRALQAQTNPHFLFNALQSIGTIALKGDGKTVYRLITQLSSMMRYTMHPDESMVTLRREVDHLQSYVRLQHVRFPDRFCIEIDVPEELQTLVVPKMILQPLAENFFKHGFERDGSSTANRFLLRIRQIGPELVVHCENSGQKIPNNQLEALQERMEQTTELRYGAEGTGLKNIRDRLMLNYKREAEFMLATPETGGFRIVMRFPAVKEADAS